MAKFEGVAVCIVILVMDIVAGILGIEGEISQNKTHHRRFMIFECREPSEQAFKLGLVAAVILALAHVAGTLLSGCMCICSVEELHKSSTNRLLAAASSLLSWIAFAVGFIMLMVGAMANSRSKSSCGISFIHHKLLSIGGILCFVHGLLFSAYYVSAASVVKDDVNQNPRPRVQTV